MKVSPRVEEYRIRNGYMASYTGDLFGSFDGVPGPCGRQLTIIASDGLDPISEGWEHVSVSIRDRVPNWQEMCFVKSLFWNPEECVVQLHPPESRYINNYSVVLHLWRSTAQEFPMPPNILVGIKELGTIA